MKDTIIQKLNEKKSQNGAEAFFLLCAQADKLSTDFQRTFKMMLRQFTEIEKLEEDKKKREQAILESYTSLVMNPKFHAETAKLINEKNKKTHKESHSSDTPPPDPRPAGGGTGQSERKDVVNEAVKTDDVDKSVLEQSAKSNQSSTTAQVKAESPVVVEAPVVEEAALKIDALRKPIVPPAGSRQ